MSIGLILFTGCLPGLATPGNRSSFYRFGVGCQPASRAFPNIAANAELEAAQNGRTMYLAILSTLKLDALV